MKEMKRMLAVLVFLAPVCTSRGENDIDPIATRLDVLNLAIPLVECKDMPVHEALVTVIREFSNAHKTHDTIGIVVANSQGNDAPLVTAALKDIPLGRALQLIAQQGGMRIGLDDHMQIHVFYPPKTNLVEVRIMTISPELYAQFNAVSSTYSAKRFSVANQWFVKRGVQFSNENARALLDHERKVLLVCNEPKELELMASLLLLRERGMRVTSQKDVDKHPEMDGDQSQHSNKREPEWKREREWEEERLRVREALIKTGTE